jgi:large subunit ribosomal protein L19
MDVSSLVEVKKNTKIPAIAPGDTVRVSTKIVEGDKERIQVYQGVVIKIKRGGNGAGYTVRHVAFGIGVERTFPFNSPMVDKVEIIRQGKVRRSRLYYLRGLSGKEARRKIKRVERKLEQVGEELLQQQPEEEIEPIMDEAAVAAAAAKAKEAEQVAAKAPEAAKEAKKEAAEKPAAAKAPEAAKEAKKETVAEKPAEKAPVAEKKEKPAAARAPEAVKEVNKEAAAEKPAEPAQDQKPEQA